MASFLPGGGATLRVARFKNDPALPVDTDAVVRPFPFGDGPTVRINPESYAAKGPEEKQKLMAHELTHVFQNTSGSAANTGVPTGVSNWYSDLSIFGKTVS